MKTGKNKNKVNYGVEEKQPPAQKDNNAVEKERELRQTEEHVTDKKQDAGQNISSKADGIDKQEIENQINGGRK